MAITIRNKETEAMIRQIGKRRKEGPSAVVRYLAKQEIGQEGGAPSQDPQRRARLWAELDREFPTPGKKPTWDEIEAEMQEMFDYLDDQGDAR